MMTPEVWFPNIGIQIEHLNDVAFRLFGINVYWYGVIIGCGILLGLALAVREAKRTGQDGEQYVDYLLFALIFAVIGARLYYVLFSWENYKDNLWDIFNLREGGLAIYGGVLAAALTAVVFTRRKKMDFFLFADTAVPSLILGQAIGRWGNFFNREAFGGFTDSLFAMRYMLNQVNTADISQSVMDHVVRFGGVDYIQVHPTFLYESLWNLCVFGILFWMQRHKKFNGQVMAFYFILYGIGRFFIEGLRTDQLQFGATGIAVSQVLSVVLVLFGAAFLFWKQKREKI